MRREPRDRRALWTVTALALAAVLIAVVALAGSRDRARRRFGGAPGPLRTIPADAPFDDPRGFAGAFGGNRGGVSGGLAVAKTLAAARAVRAQVAHQQEAPPDPGSAFDKQWTELGPSDLGGRTRAIAVDPADPNVLYAAGVTGGVWKSTDRAASWHPLTDTLSNIAVDTIAIAPDDNATIYAGTGEAYFAANGDYRGAGILRSTDSGATWAFLPETAQPGFAWVGAVRTSATTPGRVYAATVSGVWVSADGGGSWSRTLEASTPAGCLHLAVSTDQAPDTLLASCGGVIGTGAQGIFRSTDGGETWTLALGDVGGRKVGVASIAFAPSSQDVVYAAVAEASTEATLALMRSDHRGKPGSWQVVNSGDGSGGRPQFLDHCEAPETPYHQGGYSNAIAVDPTDPERVWVGGVDLFRSDDGGKTLGIASYWYALPPSSAPFPYSHADQHAIVFDPAYDGTTNRTLYLGTDGGIYRTTDDRAPMPYPECHARITSYSQMNDVRYENLNHGFAVAQFTGGSVSAGGDVLGGTQDNGAVQAGPAAFPAGWNTVLPGDAGRTAMDEVNDVRYVTSYRFAIYRSVKGGELEDASKGLNDAQGNPTEPSDFYIPLVIDPTTPATLFTAGVHVFRTTDAGASWSPIGPNLGSVITTLARAPESGAMFAGNYAGNVSRTGDALAPTPSWTDVSAGLPARRVTSLAFDPADDAIAFATFGGYGVDHVWRTADAGATWSPSGAGIPDVPVSTIAVDPVNGSKVYAGTDVGVFESLDGGATWHVANAGLATTIVSQLVFRPGTEELHAFTYGRGVFRVDLSA